MQCNFFQNNNCNQNNFSQNNYYDGIINQINNIMAPACCGLPRNFKNVWSNGKYATKYDDKNMINWQHQLTNQLNKITVTTQNIIEMYKAGYKLFQLKYHDTTGPLGNYYNCCLWEITEKWMNMMDYILCAKQLLFTKNAMDLDKMWNMKAPGAEFANRPLQYQYQTILWRSQYTPLVNACRISKNNYYKFNQSLDQYLMVVYNNPFIFTKLQQIVKNKSNVDFTIKQP